MHHEFAQQNLCEFYGFGLVLVLARSRHELELTDSQTHASEFRKCKQTQPQQTIICVFFIQRL